MVSKHTISFVFISIFKIVWCEYEAHPIQREWVSDELLPPSYNRERAPVEKNVPVEVEVYISLLSILPSVQSQVSFDVDLFLHQYWKDYRLRSPRGLNSSKLTLSSKWKERLWTPDIYFRNAIRGGVSNVMSPSVYFTINNQTNVFMATRLQITLLCDMDFRKYPFDTQTCNIRITTLSENTNTLLLSWKGFSIVKHLYLPQYDISDVQTSDECHKKYEIGQYSCLIASIVLTRNVGSFIVKRYVPSFLIVLMTFVGFWLPTTVYPARITLIITALLALITQQIQSELTVSYIYALEVWTVMCIGFVFISLLEYAVAVSWPALTQDELADRQNRIIGNNIGMKKWINFVKVVPGPKNNIIDLYARFVFPSAFLACITVYLIVYLA